MILAHRPKEVKFAFCPSLAGNFAESLSVTNVLDESNTQVGFSLASSTFVSILPHLGSSIPVDVLSTGHVG